MGIFDVKMGILEEKIGGKWGKKWEFQEEKLGEN